MPLACLAVLASASPSPASKWAAHAPPAVFSGADTVQAWCANQPRPQFAALTRVPAPSGWFQVYSVDSGVYAIAESHQWEEVISYLIVGTDRALLFDTGMGIEDIRVVVRALTDRPVAVFNSHTHPDHIGNNWAFDRIYALNTAYTRANSHGWPHGAVAAEVTPDHFCGPAPTGFDTAGYYTRPFRITDTVGNGSIIDLGGRRVQVLHIPGHAPDAAALWDEAHGLLFTGDTFYEGPIYVFAPGADADAFAQSAGRLAALAPRARKVLAAHNVPVSDPKLLLRLRDAVAEVARAETAGPRGDFWTQLHVIGAYTMSQVPSPTIDSGTTERSVLVTYDFGAFSLVYRHRVDGQ